MHISIACLYDFNHCVAVLYYNYFLAFIKEACSCVKSCCTLIYFVMFNNLNASIKLKLFSV